LRVVPSDCGNSFGKASECFFFQCFQPRSSRINRDKFANAIEHRPIRENSVAELLGSFKILANKQFFHCAQFVVRLCRSHFSGKIRGK
jgi:hypothetical protein